MPYSPLRASAFLTARPLGGVRLPFLTDVDTAFTAIQQSLKLTGVKISGPLHDYKYKPLLLSEMEQEMKNLFVHDAKSAGN